MFDAFSRISLFSSIVSPLRMASCVTFTDASPLTASLIVAANKIFQFHMARTKICAALLLASDDGS